MSRPSSQSALAPDTIDSLASSAPLSQESALAAEIKAFVTAGKHNVARERFSGLVALQQRRAARVEMAVDGAGGSALRPLHDLTPLVWEVSAP